MLGTYKNKDIHIQLIHMTLCQRGKKGGDVDNFIPIFLDLSVCQSPRYNGDNPSPHY